MNRRPPGRSRPATMAAQPRISGSQHSAPLPVKTRSNDPGSRTASGVIQVRLHEFDIGTPPIRQPPSLDERRPGEVETGHSCPEAGRDTVSVPMWHCRWTARRPADVAQPGQVEPHDAAQVARVIEVAHGAVPVRACVCGCPLVPPDPIGLAVLVHGSHDATWGTCRPGQEGGQGTWTADRPLDVGPQDGATRPLDGGPKVTAAAIRSPGTIRRSERPREEHRPPPQPREANAARTEHLPAASGNHTRRAEHDAVWSRRESMTSACGSGSPSIHRDPSVSLPKLPGPGRGRPDTGE